MTPLLEIAGARKRFATPDGTVVTALDDLSLTIGHNEFVTLLGPSGCGKTTLLRAISGFEDLDGGDIRIAGASLVGVPAHRRPVNTVFQSYALFPHMTVARNVGYSLEVAGVARAERDRRVEAALDMVGLAGYGARSVRQLSGGQQQRVALARAIIARPKLLLLDEPLSALDRNLRRKMQQELKTLQHELGISFVFVTHDQEEALTMSDRIVVLSAGRIRQLGTPEDIYFRPESRFVARFVGESNLLPVTVTRQGAFATLVFADGRRAAVPRALARADGPATLLVRPESLVVDGRAEADTDDLVRFEGTVLHAAFTGTDYELEIDVPGLQRLKASLPNRLGLPAARHVGGQGVSVHLPLAAVHLIDEAGDDASVGERAA